MSRCQTAITCLVCFVFTLAAISWPLFSAEICNRTSIETCMVPPPDPDDTVECIGGGHQFMVAQDCYSGLATGIAHSTQCGILYIIATGQQVTQGGEVVQCGSHLNDSCQTMPCPTGS